MRILFFVGLLFTRLLPQEINIRTFTLTQSAHPPMHGSKLGLSLVFHFLSCGKPLVAAPLPDPAILPLFVNHAGPPPLRLCRFCSFPPFIVPQVSWHLIVPPPLPLPAPL